MTESTNVGGESAGRSQGSNAGSAANEVRRAFAGLPFDQKISTLIQVELDMLGDAVNSVVTAVSKAVDDVARACESSEQSGPATSGAAGQASTS
jgi:hypothetical protein